LDAGLQRLSTGTDPLNIAGVSAPATGQQPVRRMAARRTRHHLLLWPSQPEMDTQVGDMEGRKVAGSSVRTPYWITWLADLTQMQATYALPEGRPGWFQSVC
jgi:hypothetical protein